MSIEYKKQFFILLAFFGLALVMAASASAQTFTSRGVDMRGLQQNSCRSEALGIKAEFLRLKQEVAHIIRCNARGEFFQNGGCVEAVVTPHNYLDPAPVSGNTERRGGLRFDTGAYGLIGGAVGEQAQCVATGCSYDGTDYKDGEKLFLYEQSDSCGARCIEREFTCNSGSFDTAIPSGLYNTAGSCPAGPCDGCTHPVTGDPMADGETAMVYNPVRACGDGCTSENIRCADGTLEDPAWGTSYSSTCPDEPTNCDECPHPVTGDMYAEGDKITLYKENSACGSCSDRIYTCSGGSFGSATGYNHEDLTSCEEANACPPGCPVYVGGAYQTTIGDNEDITYYAPSTGAANCGTCADTSTKTCSGGNDINFSSAYDPALVSESQCEAQNSCPGACTITWTDAGYSESVPHGDDVNAYQSGSVPFGNNCSSIAQVRECDNTVLSGSYTYKNCAPEGAANCSINWLDAGTETVTHNNSVSAYASGSVPYGSSCSSQTRTCNDGTLSGSNRYKSCAPEDPASCTYNGNTVPHGESRDFWTDASPSCGSSCDKVSRTCNNGSWGTPTTHTATSCTEPKCCNAQTLEWPGTTHDGTSCFCRTNIPATPVGVRYRDLGSNHQISTCTGQADWECVDTGTDQVFRLNSIISCGSDVSLQ